MRKIAYIAALLGLLCLPVTAQNYIVPPGATAGSHLPVLLSASLDSLSVRTGLELVTNGDFSSWSGAADPDNVPTGWTVLGIVNGTNYLQDATNACRIISDGSITEKGVYKTILTVGKCYRFGLTVTSRTAGQLTTYSCPAWWDNGAGAQVQYGRAKDTLYRVKGAPNSATQDITFTDTTVREYWLADNSPYARHLSPENAPVWSYVNGQTMMNFNGSTDLVDTGSDFIGTGDVSIVAVVRAESAGEGGFGRILANSDLNNAMNFNVVNSAEKYKIRLGDGQLGIISGELVYNTPYLICLIRAANGAVSLFVDNVLVSTGSVGTPAAGSTNVFIGNRAAGDRPFDGDLAVWVYSGIMGATERAAVTAELTARYGL